MPGKLAIIGPFDLVEKVQKVCLDSRWSFSVLPLPYSREVEAVDIVRKNHQQADVLLFTGPIPYQLCLGLSTKPSVYINYDGTGLMRCLIQILYYGKGDITKISLDTLAFDKVKTLYAELGLSFDSVYCHASQDGATMEELLEFHSSLHREGKTSVAITCLSSAYEHLKRAGLNVYRITPTYNSIVQALQTAEILFETKRSKAAQIATGIFKIVDWQSTDDVADYLNKRKSLQLHGALLQHAEYMQGSVAFDGAGEYTLYVTRGALGDEHFDRAVSMIKDVRSKVDVVLAVGLGTGMTILDAETNAKAALAKSLHEDYGTVYVMLEDGSTIGPLADASALRYSNRTEDPLVIAAADQAGLSVATISKLMALQDMLGKDTLTANEVSTGLRLTIRSARRILAALEEAKLAVVVGEEQPAGRGRPRRVYKLMLG